LQIADLFVLVSRPSIKESFGLVYLEANACGKAVVAGSTGGVHEAVEDGVSGILVNPTNIKDISGEIIRLLNNDNLRSTLEEKGYRRLKKKFSNTIMAQNTITSLLSN
jgi:glycosyltransferase involved in cell wall biosynthesis